MKVFSSACIPWMVQTRSSATSQAEISMGLPLCSSSSSGSLAETSILPYYSEIKRPKKEIDSLKSFRTGSTQMTR